MTNSRFTDVINAARNKPEQPQDEQPQAPVNRPVQQQAVNPAPVKQALQQPAKRGRPAGGKRNNPDYEQVGAYIPKELNKRVKMRLLEMDKDREFSELVEYLLKKWVRGEISG
jgi:hypothetical protein